DFSLVAVLAVAALALAVFSYRRQVAVRRSEERFQSLARNAFELVTVTDIKGTILYESPALERVLGYKPQERVGSKGLDYIHPDALTGLPNRALFQNQLEVALARAARRQRTIAVLFVDLDRFKIINDSLGHDTGDDLLVAVARRLQESVRDEDTVARLSGDEFTVLLEEVEDEVEAASVAQRIIDDIRQAIDLEGHQVFVGASVGIALSHNGEDRAEDLLRDADLAMYRAKERGRSR